MQTDSNRVQCNADNADGYASCTKYPSASPLEPSSEPIPRRIDRAECVTLTLILPIPEPIEQVRRLCLAVMTIISCLFLLNLWAGNSLGPHFLL